MKRHARIALRRTTATRVPTAEKPWDLQERLIEEKSDRRAFVFIFAQPATEVDAVNKDQTFLTLIRERPQSSKQLSRWDSRTIHTLLFSFQSCLALVSVLTMLTGRARTSS